MRRSARNCGRLEYIQAHAQPTSSLLEMQWTNGKMAVVTIFLTVHAQAGLAYAVISTLPVVHANCNVHTLSGIML